MSDDKKRNTDKEADPRNNNNKWIDIMPQSLINYFHDSPKKLVQLVVKRLRGEVIVPWAEQGIFKQFVKGQFTSSEYEGPEFDAEKSILNDIMLFNMDLPKGVLVGLACFAFMRADPLGRMLQRRMGRGPSSQGPLNPFINNSSGYKFDPLPGAQPKNLERPGLLFRVLLFSFDTLASLFLGAHASLYFVDEDRMRKQISDIPLTEGRSPLSEEFCSDVTQAFQKLNHPSLSGGSVDSNKDNGEMDSRMRTLQGFVINCRRRAIYEEELRRERGINASEPVVVPPPGVPRDIPVSLDELLTGFGREEDTRNDDDYFDTDFDGDDGDQDQDS